MSVCRVLVLAGMSLARMPLLLSIVALHIYNGSGVTEALQPRAQLCRGPDRTRPFICNRHAAILVTI